MENVYAPENFSATEPLDLTKYFKEYQAECNLQKLDSASVLERRLQILKEDFKLPLSLDDVKALEELCTIDKLNLSNENSKLPIKSIPRDHEIPATHPITTEAKTLETVKCKESFNNMRNDLQLDLKTVGLSLDDSKEDPNSVKDLQPGSTFIHKVVIHIPFNTLLGNRLTADSVRVQYEIEVLGKNTLFELANTIQCVSDVFIIKEVENTRIDLNDLLNAKVTFDALKPRLGFGYVYIHHGNCEHVVNFSDTRLIQSSDCLVSTKYPRIISLKRHTSHLCFICSENHASWLVVNSDRVPVKKAFFCTKCCESYMFFDGKKIGTFQLYPYYNGAIPPPSQEDRLEQDENDWGFVDEN